MALWSIMSNFNLRDLWFIVGINVINECSSGFRNSGCLFYDLLKPEEGGTTIPSGRCLKRSMLKSLRSKMLALPSATLSIVFMKSSGHP